MSRKKFGPRNAAVPQPDRLPFPLKASFEDDSADEDCRGLPGILCSFRRRSGWECDAAAMRCFFIAIALPLLCGLAQAKNYLVNPQGQPYSLREALAKAVDGDVIELLPGEYAQHAMALPARRLTLRGLGDVRPVLHGRGGVAEGKAIWVVKGGEITIENLEFRAARAPDRNGAGLRLESGRLTVRHSAFFDNENGVLTVNDQKSELRVEDSIFAHAPRDAGWTNHLIYVGRIARFELRGSRLHDGAKGHLLKSRARENWVLHNLLVDGEQGQASYEIDLPNGGDALLLGNVLVQGPNTENPVVVAFGAEGGVWPRNRLRLAHNTLVNDSRKPAWFLRVWGDKLGEVEPEVLAVNNLTVGLGTFNWSAAGRFEGNHNSWRSPLAEPLVFDYALRPDSALRGRAPDPATIDPELVPKAEFQLPLGTRPLAPPARWSPGAFQR